MLNKRMSEAQAGHGPAEARGSDANVLPAHAAPQHEAHQHAPKIVSARDQTEQPSEHSPRHGQATAPGVAPGRLRRATLLLGKGLLPLLLLAAGFATFKYLKATKPEAPKQLVSERVFAVETVPVRFRTEQPMLKLYGTIVAGRQFDIRALVAGRVMSTSDELREGGRVATGMTLLNIDSFDYKSSLAETTAQREETLARLREQEASIVQAKTSLTHARAQLALSKADVERAEALKERGNLAERAADDRRQIMLQRQQAADQLANELGVWEARVAQTRATAERLSVSIERAERRLLETELKAPFDAYVTEVAAQVGRMLSVNDKVATLIDAGWIEAQFTLTDSQFGRMVTSLGKLEGQTLKVRWALGNGMFDYPATIARVGARVSSTTGGVDVFARIADPSKPVPLRPGAFVEIEVPDIRFDDVARVPSASLYDRDTIYVVKNGRLDPRKVTVVGTAQSDILVRGPLTEDEPIVTTRLSTPGKGLAVKDIAASSAGPRESAAQ
ncbi:MAG: efflux RND transporter periplasmic adaptor subunit [Hyphomicrobiaceae bacterium]|nr:efflux RND transporter periplasmic adaptor subunit [Hyphomicrobiaceae bacterium]